MNKFYVCGIKSSVKIFLEIVKIFGKGRTILGKSNMKALTLVKCKRLKVDWVKMMWLQIANFKLKYLVTFLKILSCLIYENIVCH